MLELDFVKNEVVWVVKEGFDLIVVVGGDGILSEVVDGLVGLKKWLLLVIIFVGIINDYVWVLWVLCDNLVVVVKLILELVNWFKIDIGQVGDKYFMNIVVGGILMELIYDVLL